MVSSPIGCSEASVAFNITDETATPPTYETFYRCNAALNLAGLNCSIPPCDQKVKARFDLDNSDSNITVTRNAKGEAAGDNAILICKGKGKANQRCSPLGCMTYCSPFTSSGQTFKTRNQKSLDQLTVTCVWVPSASKSDWRYDDEGQSMDELPECDLYCPGSPPSPAGATVSWDNNNWDESVLSYTCQDSSK